MKIKLNITKIIALTTIFIIAGLSTNNASAEGTRAAAYKKVRINQAKRIRHGVRKGTLTRAEARGLVKQQVRTKKMVKKFSEDGFTDLEKAVIKKKLKKSSKSIYKQKHDGQERQINFKEAHKLRKLIKKAKLNDGSISAGEKLLIKKAYAKAKNN